MTDLENPVDPEVASGWVTVDFRPGGPEASATLVANGQETYRAPFAGWLIQELVVTRAGRVIATGLPGRRVVPGYFRPSGEVVTLSGLRVENRGGAELEWRLAIDGRDVQPVVVPDVNITVEPAPVHVEVVEPKTRKVVRDKAGNITKVVEE